MFYLRIKIAYLLFSRYIIVRLLPNTSVTSILWKYYLPFKIQLKIQSYFLTNTIILPTKEGQLYSAT